MRFNLVNGEENQKDKAEDNQARPRDDETIGLAVLQIWERLKRDKANQAVSSERQQFCNNVYFKH